MLLPWLGQDTPYGWATGRASPQASWGLLFCRRYTRLGFQRPILMYLRLVSCGTLLWGAVGMFTVLRCDFAPFVLSHFRRQIASLSLSERQVETDCQFGNGALLADDPNGSCMLTPRTPQPVRLTRLVSPGMCQSSPSN